MPKRSMREILDELNEKANNLGYLDDKTEKILRENKWTIYDAVRIAQRHVDEQESHSGEVDLRNARRFTKRTIAAWPRRR